MTHPARTSPAPLCRARHTPSARTTTVGIDGFRHRRTMPASQQFATAPARIAPQPAPRSMPASASVRVPASPQPRSLSQREQQVVDAVARGLRSRDIAEELGISVHTVEATLRHARQKLGVSRRSALVATMSAPVALRPVTPVALTSDERALVEALASGATTTEAAKAAFMSTRTAQRRLRALRAKLDAATTHQVVWLCVAAREGAHPGPRREVQILRG